MKRGSAGSDDRSDGSSPPGGDGDRPEKRSYVAKGKGRARTPPPRELTHAPPEMSDDQGAGRSTDNVVREAVAGFLSVAASRAAEVSDRQLTILTSHQKLAFCLAAEVSLKVKSADNAKIWAGYSAEYARQDAESANTNAAYIISQYTRQPRAPTPPPETDITTGGRVPIQHRGLDDPKDSLGSWVKGPIQ